MLRTLSADGKIFQLLSELESGWSALVGSSWKPKISLFSMSNSQKKISSKIYNKWNVIPLSRKLESLLLSLCYSIIRVGCVPKKLARFGWKAVLISQWWCHSKKSDFTFVFTTTSGQKGFQCWRPSSDKLKLHVSQREERKWELSNFFSHCIVLTACLCLHETARFL